MTEVIITFCNNTTNNQNIIVINNSGVITSMLPFSTGSRGKETTWKTERGLVQICAGRKDSACT